MSLFLLSLLPSHFVLSCFPLCVCLHHASPQRHHPSSHASPSFTTYPHAHTCYGSIHPFPIPHPPLSSPTFTPHVLLLLAITITIATDRDRRRAIILPRSCIVHLNT
ncbi:hypothetical protein BD413DRAFT_5897 [Trametes elegans]|nr:hypothetical protein BD413DRAFT_5897 [Trametes elegans]